MNMLQLILLAAIGGFVIGALGFGVVLGIL